MTEHPLIGIGARAPHYDEIIQKQPPIGWLEVHSENFFAPGGKIQTVLHALQDIYPLSLHGVGLSLGSHDGISFDHLKRLSQLVKIVRPKFLSEHLSWGYIKGIYMPDLLPIPYTQESFKVLKQNIITVQDYLKQTILIENPSSYIEYTESNQCESHFLVDLCKETDARILLDINNIYVSSWNHGWDAKKYIDSIPKNFVKEIHLAGHSTKKLPNNDILRIDTHDHPVCSDVWHLYEYALQRFGQTPTLLEWDSNIPSLNTLMTEALKCTKYLLSSLPQVNGLAHEYTV